MTFEEWVENQIEERNEVYEEIGQECYDNGYQQGRADAINELCARLKGTCLTINPYKVIDSICKQMKESDYGED